MDPWWSCGAQLLMAPERLLAGQRRGTKAGADARNCPCGKPGTALGLKSIPGNTGHWQKPPKHCKAIGLIFSRKPKETQLFVKKGGILKQTQNQHP
jgi:hypothetical protein